MNKYLVIRAIATFVTSSSVTIVVKNIIEHTTPKNVGPINKILISIGGFVIGGMVADQACEHVSKKMDELLKDKSLWSSVQSSDIVKVMEEEAKKKSQD